ncbi:hypothetical protein [Halosimplex marinum]|uniref:hypothetical protein n=1 Tax=Halosimplex marinum TaxID=3396620 RepID=UPI003F57F2A6
MPRLTRRRALQVAVGLAAGLAGCPDGETDAGRGDAGTAVGSPTPPASGGDEGADDIESVTLRADDAGYDDPLAWFVPDPRDRATAGGTVDPSDRAFEGLIGDAPTAETLRVTDRATETEASVAPETARRFVAGTDFDSETLLVEGRSVGECYRLVLCSVFWEDGEVETRYGRFLRDADAACEADARDAHVTIARLPVSLDPAEFEMGATGVASGRCFRPEAPLGTPRPRSATATAGRTDAASGTEAPSGTAGDASADTTDLTDTGGGSR